MPVVSVMLDDIRTDKEAVFKDEGQSKKQLSKTVEPTDKTTL